MTADPGCFLTTNVFNERALLVHGYTSTVVSFKRDFTLSTLSDILLNVYNGLELKLTHILFYPSTPCLNPDGTGFMFDCLSVQSPNVRFCLIGIN